MPRFNQAGPEGMGPMTGWGRGVCSTGRAVDGSGIPGNMGYGRGIGLGRGFRRGFGAQMNAYPARGMGRGRGPYFQAYPEDAQFELGRLKNEAANMQNALEAINARITEMENN
jgi:hypothetical protein